MTPRKPKKAKAVLQYAIAHETFILVWTLSVRVKYARAQIVTVRGKSWPQLRREGYRVIRVEVREVEK